MRPLVPHLSLAVLVLTAPPAGAISWTELQFQSAVPTARMAHTAIPDPARGRMIVFGGVTVSGVLDDVWILSLSPEPQWQELPQGGQWPGARRDATAVYDSRRDRMIVFGGDDNDSQYNDVWALSLSQPMTWTQIAPLGTPPVPRTSHTAVFDPAGDRMVVHGGFNGVGLEDDLWELTLGAVPQWNQLAPAGPAPGARRDAVAAYDPIGGRLLLNGGFNGFVPFLNDTWAYDLAGPGGWNEIAPLDTVPDGAITHAGTMDPVRNRFIMFAGNYHSNAWALNFGGPAQWQEINETGPLPTGRVDHTLVYMSGRDELVVFGGHSGPAVLDDTWVLPLSTASAVRPPVAAPRALRVWPNPTSDHARIISDAGTTVTVYDVRGRVVARLEVPVSGSVAWNLRDRRGTIVPSGVYFARSGGLTRRFIVVR